METQQQHNFAPVQEDFNFSISVDFTFKIANRERMVSAHPNIATFAGKSILFFNLIGAEKLSQQVKFVAKEGLARISQPMLEQKGGKGVPSVVMVLILPMTEKGTIQMFHGDESYDFSWEKLSPMVNRYTHPHYEDRGYLHHPEIGVCPADIHAFYESNQELLQNGLDTDHFQKFVWKRYAKAKQIFDQIQAALKTQDVDQE